MYDTEENENSGGVGGYNEGSGELDLGDYGGGNALDLNGYSELGAEEEPDLDGYGELESGEELDLDGYDESESGEELDLDGYDEEPELSEEDEDTNAEYSDEESYDYNAANQYDSGEEVYTGEDTNYNSNDDYSYSEDNLYSSGSGAFDNMPNAQYQNAPPNGATGGGAAPVGPAKPVKKSSSTMLLLLLMLLLIGVMGYTYKTTGGFDVRALFSKPAPAPAVQAKNPKTIEDVAIQEQGDKFFDSAVNVKDANGQNVQQIPDEKLDAAKASQAQQEKTVQIAVVASSQADDTSKIAVPVRTGGRAEPFYPIGYSAPRKIVNDDYIIAPPLAEPPPEQDNILQKMTKIAVNGIMYDKDRPAAIIQYNGVDQLVHKGDTIEDYQIVDITKNEVTIKDKNGKNTFKAALGQELATTSAPSGSYAEMDYNAVKNVVPYEELVPPQMRENKNININNNVQNRFGGAYRSTPKGVITINGKP